MQLFPSTFPSQFSNFPPFLLLYVLSSLHTPIFCFLSPPKPTLPQHFLPLLCIFLSSPSFPLFTFLSYSLIYLDFSFIFFFISFFTSNSYFFSFLPHSFLIYFYNLFIIFTPYPSPFLSYSLIYFDMLPILPLCLLTLSFPPFCFLSPSFPCLDLTLLPCLLISFPTS